MEQLKATWQELTARYSADTELKNRLWTEIEEAYSSKKRHYHTLEHLSKMLAGISHCKAEIKKLDTLLFSVFYHDIIYNVTKGNNEEKSAKLAGKRLNSLGFPSDQTACCIAQIEATKLHEFSDDPDTNYLLDLDLIVLGMDEPTYFEYVRNIRKEYSIFPDFLYKPGRKKVLKHFLEQEQIFKTPYFIDEYEPKAQCNLNAELAMLEK